MKRLYFKYFIGCFLILSLTACDQNSGGSSSTTSSETKTEAAGGDLEGFMLTDLAGSKYQKAEKLDENYTLSKGVHVEGYVLNGKREGTWVTYEKRYGLPKAVTPYKDGQIHGIVLNFDDRGAVNMRSAYVNGKLDGYKVVYTRTIIKDEMFYKNGELHGTKKSFFDDGKIRQETEYDNGKRNGKDTYYRQDGTISLQYEYKNGERVGEVKDPPTPPAAEGESK